MPTSFVYIPHFSFGEESADSSLFPSDYLPYLETEVKEVRADLQACVSPQLVYACYEHPTFTDTAVYLEGQCLHVGRKLVRLLEGCQRVMPIVYTLGEDVCDLYRHYQQTGEYVKGYICDILANWALDKTLAEFRRYLTQSQGFRNLSFTISPGCCGWNIADQPTLFATVDAEMIHVKLTASQVMQPFKSISGLLAAGGEMVYPASECAYCGRKDCGYRKMRHV